MAALTNKRIGDKHRHEITQEICSRIINFCKYPTKKQRDIVASKLVQKFPQLRDCSFTCGHVSSNIYQSCYLLASCYICAHRNHGLPNFKGEWLI